eukprot:g62910.t1
MLQFLMIKGCAKDSECEAVFATYESDGLTLKSVLDAISNRLQGLELGIQAIYWEGDGEKYSGIVNNKPDQNAIDHAANLPEATQSLFKGLFRGILAKGGKVNQEDVFRIAATCKPKCSGPARETALKELQSQGWLHELAGGSRQHRSYILGPRSYCDLRSQIRDFKTWPNCSRCRRPCVYARQCRDISDSEDCAVTIHRHCLRKELETKQAASCPECQSAWRAVPELPDAAAAPASQAPASQVDPAAAAPSQSQSQPMRPARRRKARALEDEEEEEQEQEDGQDEASSKRDEAEEQQEQQLPRKRARRAVAAEGEDGDKEDCEG